MAQKSVQPAENNRLCLNNVVSACIQFDKNGGFLRSRNVFEPEKEILDKIIWQYVRDTMCIHCGNGTLEQNCHCWNDE